MPYLKQIDRLDIDDYVEFLATLIKKPGDLNYTISKLYNEVLENIGLNYANIAMLVADTEGALAEFQRRIVGPYEDLKIKENGDLYTVEIK